MRKKVLCMLLAGVMALSMSACGSSDKGGDSGSEKEGQETQKTEEKKEEAPAEVTMEETVMLDQNGVTITATGIKDGDVQIKIENGSDRRIGVCPKQSFVNNYILTDYNEGFFETIVYTEVNAGVALIAEPGETAEGESRLLGYEAEKLQLENIGLVEGALFVFDADTCELLVATELTEMKTSAYDKMDGGVMPDEVELYNANGVVIKAGNMQYNKEYDRYEFDMYVDNQSGSDIHITGKEKADDMWGYSMGDVPAGRRSFDQRGFDKMSMDGTFEVKEFYIEVSDVNGAGGNVGEAIPLTAFEITEAVEE